MRLVFLCKPNACRWFPRNAVQAFSPNPSTALHAKWDSTLTLIWLSLGFHPASREAAAEQDREARCVGIGQSRGQRHQCLGSTAMAGFPSDSTSNMDDLGTGSVTVETLPKTRQRETCPLSPWLQVPRRQAPNLSYRFSI